MDQFERHLAAVRKHEPTVRALAYWDEADARRRSEATGRGPLAGWAIGVKDIIDVKGLPTRCGVKFMPDVPAEKNANVDDRLESLGAYVFCKPVTTRFTYLDPGPTRNPWNPQHTPGGSSSGSAAAVAAGMVRMSLGTQTVGSIGRPASFCGIVGFKPTYERMPHEGLFPFSPSVDTIGFFTSHMADMQNACAAFFGEPKAKAPSSLRVGMLDNLHCRPADEQMLEAVRRVGEKLEAAGFEARPARLPESMRDTHENHTMLVAGEAAVSHRELFEKCKGCYTTKLRELLLRGKKISTEQLQLCRQRRAQIQGELDGMFDEFDLLLSPSAPGAAPKGLSITGDPRMNLIFTHTRVPALTLPVELNPAGLPLGIQLTARKMQDHSLLAAGLQIERVVAFDAHPRERGNSG